MHGHESGSYAVKRDKTVIGLEAPADPYWLASVRSRLPFGVLSHGTKERTVINSRRSRGWLMATSSRSRRPGFGS